MANKRMFSLDVVDTDTFIEMPATSQNLYFHLGMRADDDGFVSSPRKIMKMLGCGNDDLRILIERKYVIYFESGVIVLSDWNINNNKIKGDRYKPTRFQNELSLLSQKSAVYGLKNSLDTTWNHNDSIMEPQSRVDKSRIDKNRINTLAQSVPEEPSTPKGKAIISLQLNTGKEYEVYEDQIKQWEEIYPGVNVTDQLRAMKGWCISNPTKRKTKNGINRFINGWLSKEQDKPKQGQAKKGSLW